MPTRQLNDVFNPHAGLFASIVVPPFLETYCFYSKFSVFASSHVVWDHSRSEGAHSSSPLPTHFASLNPCLLPIVTL